MKRVLAVTVLLAVAVVTSGCDTFVGYTVTNNSSEDLQAWVFFNDCDKIVGYRDEYDYRRDIPAGSTVEVFGATGPLPKGDWCLQVVDSQQRLVMSEPYTNGAYELQLTVADPLTRGPQLPHEDERPKRPLPESLWRQFTIAPVGWIVAAVVMFGIVYGIIVGLRALWKNR